MNFISTGPPDKNVWEVWSELLRNPATGLSTTDLLGLIAYKKERREYVFHPRALDATHRE